MYVTLRDPTVPGAGRGAALGPILAFGVLLVTSNDYRSVFVCSLGMAFVGLAMLSQVRDPAATPTIPVQRALRGPLLASLKGTGLWRVCVGAGLLAMATYGRLSVVSQLTPAAPAVTTGRTCQRLDARSGRVVCVVVENRFLNPVHACVLDEDLRQLHDLEIKGTPSRVRLSPDGRLVAVTVFVNGHTYATAGFSTSTTIWDTTTGEQLADLEQFRFTDGGAEVRAADRNFWGVTFSEDGRTFFATMSTAGRTMLVRGDLARSTGETLTDGVECPALSPDETRIAFKQRRPGDRVNWTLAVIDLRTMARTGLAVEGDVDDQPYWLDDATVAYGQERATSGEQSAHKDTSAVPADASPPPRLVRRDATSLVVDSQRPERRPTT